MKCSVGNSFVAMEFHDKIILHPTDFSDNAAKALKAATDLLKIPDSRIMVLHICEYPQNAGHPSVDELEKKVSEKRKEAAALMETYMKKCFGKTEPNPLPERNIELSTSAYKGILDVIDRIGPYMVVVGQKGSSTVPNILMGSTTKHLIEKADCPVLVVPEKFEETM
jgi:nucleotide-binding universal stress UspA family protein